MCNARYELNRFNDKAENGIFGFIINNPYLNINLLGHNRIQNKRARNKWRH